MKKSFFVLFLLISVALLACGKKGNPLPQKIDQLISLQNVFATINPEGTITVMGTVVGSKQNAQSFTLELEPVEEDCIGCPFVPTERYTKIPSEAMVNKKKGEFSITVLPAASSNIYRWRVVVRNSVSGLPSAMTPVFKVNKPFDDKRNFVEIRSNKK